jgi:2-isopropylmalate synthase
LGHALEGVVDPRELSRLVKTLEAEGASYEGAEASFELLIHRRRPGYRPPFRVLASTVHVAWNDGLDEPAELGRGPLGEIQRMSAEATVKLAVGDEVLHTAAEGNGPVNALDQALRRALGVFYPILDDVHLVDYKVRIVDGEAATAARTRVLIESRDTSGRSWTTVGSATNIIAASAAALIDSLEYAIWKSGAEVRPRDIRSVPTAIGAAPIETLTVPSGGNQ